MRSRQEFAGKNVLLVDDSHCARNYLRANYQYEEAGAKKVYFASAAPEIRFPNVYGIDMPSPNELIAYGRDVDEIARMINADGLIYQDLEDLVAAVSEENPSIQNYETSVFDGKYVTGDIDQHYLDTLNVQRNDDAKSGTNKQELNNLDLHNHQ